MCGKRSHFSLFLCETVVCGQHILFLLSRNPFVPFSACWRSKVFSSCECVGNRCVCLLFTFPWGGGIPKGDCPVCLFRKRMCLWNFKVCFRICGEKKENLFIHSTWPRCRQFNFRVSACRMHKFAIIFIRARQSFSRNSKLSRPRLKTGRAFLSFFQNFYSGNYIRRIRQKGGRRRISRLQRNRKLFFFSRSVREIRFQPLPLPAW